MIDKETIEMEWQVKVKGEDLSPLDKMLVDQNEKLRGQRDLNYQRYQYWKARFVYYANRGKYMAYCPYCEASFFRAEIPSHQQDCERHPITGYKKKIASLEARIVAMEKVN